MTSRPQVLEAKIEKLAEIVMDGNDVKDRGNATVSESRQAQRDAAKEVLEANGSVAAVNRVRAPSERL